jgi:hypothetical protein
VTLLSGHEMIPPAGLDDVRDRNRVVLCVGGPSLAKQVEVAAQQTIHRARPIAHNPRQHYVPIIHDGIHLRSCERLAGVGDGALRGRRGGRHRRELRGDRPQPSSAGPVWSGHHEATKSFVRTSLHWAAE